MLAPLRERVEVGESGAETSLGLAPNPTWRPVVLDRDEAGAPVLHAGLREGRFWILTADGREEAVPAAALDGSLHVPEEGPFVVEFWARDGRRARAVFREAPGEGGPVLVLPPARPEEPWDQDTSGMLHLSKKSR